MSVTREDHVMTGLTLANIVEVTADVIKHVAGDDIATQLNGERLDGSTLAEVIAVKLQSKLASHVAL